MPKAKLTTKQLIYEWLKLRQEHSRREISTYDLDELRKWAIRVHGISHTMATYEREFRKVRNKYPHRFRDISDKYPNKDYKTWEIKPKE